MPQTFDCPKCGAPVTSERPTDFATTRTTVRCEYCHSQLIAPNELAGRPAQVVQIKIGLSEGSKFPKWIWLVLAIPLIGLIIAGLAALGALAPLFYSVSRPAVQPVKPVAPTLPNKETKPGFASVLLDFGKEGIGAGMFNDARSIAVDGAGRIYVGEYTGGRIQVFDPEGKFVTQWSIGDRKTILRGLAADRKGTVYVVEGGHIDRYRGETGEKVGEVAYERNGFDDVSVGADGGLVAAWQGNRDDLVVFDANGKLVRTIPEAISGASGDSELAMRVAVDGAGNIFALGRFNNGVFKFGRDGKFINRFGDDGDQPGQFRAPYSIAVDGYGRVYVGDMKGIQVFDGNGRYVSVINVKNVAFGMVFNDKNELFVVARDHVVKYSVPTP
ncbi:MAG TPA: NHL repeat-containing protein [Pyrinomonadaceae bacterium]|nr:NHL repeat-containing protein [Pyrinomonadaceae bacterium]